MTLRNTFLLDFSRDRQVAVEQAFIDRMKIKIGDWGLYGSEDNVCETFSDLRHIEVQTSEGEMIPLFKGDAIETFRQNLNIHFSSPQKDEKHTEVAPLLSGRLRYGDRYHRPEALKDATSRIHFETTLNLTRFVRAQKFKLRTPTNRNPRLLTPLVLAIDPDEDLATELPLAPATNIIMGKWTKYAYARSKPMEDHFRTYLKLVHGLLDRSLRNATPDGVDAPRYSGNYSLQEIEFYWEYDCDNPIGMVNELIPRLRPMASKFWEGSVEVTEPEAVAKHVDQNSPNIKALIGQGTWLKIYAKTTRRVRFEIELKSAIIGKKANGQTATTRRRLSQKIPVLAEFAANKLNQILPALLDGPTPRSNVPALRLMSEVNSLCDGPHTAEAILGALIAFGRVTLYNNSPLKGPVHGLRDRGVLRTAIPRSRNYVVTDEYSNALRALCAIAAAE